MSEGRENIDLLALALAYHRVPLDHRERVAEIAILPEDMGRLLWLANGSAETLAAAARQVGAEAGEIRAAALFLLQRLCFARDASHYRILGLNPDATSEQIKEHHRLLMRLVHPDRAGVSDFWVDSYAARVNEAYSVLSRPQTRAAYNEFLARQEPTAVVVPAVPRPRSSAWLAAPHRRRPILALPAHLPALVLGGLAFVAVLGVAGVYLLAKPSIVAPAESESVVVAEVTPPPVMPATDGVIAAFQTRPDWRALEQIEQEASARASRILAHREQLEAAHQDQLRIEQAELERLRGERALLEQQLRAARLEVERRRLEQLRVEQDRTERLRTERLNAERQKIEQLRAEQAQAEKLTAEAHAERRKLERLRAARAQAEQRAEQRPKEPVRTPPPVEHASRTPSPQLSPSKAEREPLASPKHDDRQAAARDLTARELDQLIGRYTSAYQSGDLDRLMALFDTQARGSGGKNRDLLRLDYVAFFGATQSRRLNLTQMRWDPRGTVASGVARYHLRAVRTDGSTRDYAGSIRFEVSRQDARVVIQSIDFDIRRLE
jgi:curved DNA-binding protein CbpA